ncbi:hypothetical protein [Sulfurovum sp.]|uniref:hypothetical protein n=1 Tax=Sulfurovum sp. TaxID=1969726 RepID=UPI00356A9AB0
MISSKTEIITQDEAKIMFYAMVTSTYLQGIVEGINYAVPYSDATELAKSRTSKSIMEMACKNVFENRTLHGFDSDYKWQVMKLASKKHSKMKQQF